MPEVYKIKRTLLWLQLKVSRPRPIFRLICLKIGLGRETFSCNHKSVRLILWKALQSGRALFRLEDYYIVLPEVYNCNCIEFPPFSIKKSSNNAQFSWHQIFLDVSFFPFHSFFSLIFFFSCFCTALVQDQVHLSTYPPVGVSFRLIINQFIWIWYQKQPWLFLTSFRAEVGEEQEWWVGFPRLRAYACIRCGASSRKRHGNSHECQSPRTFENFSSNAQLRGAFSSTFTRFSLVRPPQSY